MPKYELTFRVFGKVRDIDNCNSGNITDIRRNTTALDIYDNGMYKVEGIFCEVGEGDSVPAAMADAKSRCDYGELHELRFMPIGVKALQSEVPWSVRVKKSNLAKPSEDEDREIHFDIDDYSKLYIRDVLKSTYKGLNEKEFCDFDILQGVIGDEIQTVIHAYMNDTVTGRKNTYFLSLDSEDMNKLLDAIDNAEEQFKAMISKYGVKIDKNYAKE